MAGSYGVGTGGDGGVCGGKVCDVMKEGVSWPGEVDRYQRLNKVGDVL